MATSDRAVFAFIAVLVLGAAPAAGQQAPPVAPDTAGGLRPGEIQLVYDREVFVYDSGSRRDPFRPLSSDAEGLGPNFDQLVLRGIIFSPIESRSVALLVDGSGQIYRVKQGDLVGNSQVVSIQPLRVVFRVESFGVSRQEILDLKRPDIGGGQR